MLININRNNRKGNGSNGDLNKKAWNPACFDNKNI